jgi:putative transposase
VEAIIESTLRELWLVPEAPDLAPVVHEIAARCAEAALTPPSYVSVQRRLPKLFTPQELATKRSSNPNDIRRLKARPGIIKSAAPLAVGQIDHTPADIQFAEVIDSEGLFVGRPSITLLTDVHSKCITGFCLTIEKPSTLSVALCLAHAICRKEDWLAARGIKHAWPTFGRPKGLVVDSGSEFKGASFDKACAEYSIKIKRRNAGTVHIGGVVERLLGKINHYMGRYDGRTGSSVADRDGYASEARACLTFEALEICIALAIIDHNDHMNEKTLKVPIKEWLSHVPDQSKFTDEPDAVLLNFMPRKRRKLGPQGVPMFALDYYSPWFGVHVPYRDRLGKLEVCFDPRDISHIYARDPDSGQFRPVARRDGDTTPITLWQHKRNRRKMRAENTRAPTKKVAIAREIGSIVADAKKQKPKIPRTRKAGARDLVRARHAAKGRKPYENMKAAEPAPAPHPSRPKRILPLDDW